MSLVKCSKCNIAKKINDFYLNNRKTNGLDSICKNCILKRKAIAYKRKIKKEKKRNCTRNKVVDVRFFFWEEVKVERKKSDVEDVLGELISIVT